MKGLRNKAYDEAENLMMYMWRLSSSNNLNPPVLANIGALEYINLLAGTMGIDIETSGRSVSHGSNTDT